MTTVELRRLTKHFGRDVVVRGVDLSIHDAELFVIVGPSGCGKTSVLRMIAGLEPITGGTVLIDGEPVTGDAAHTHDVAMMFQEPALYPHMTVRENLAFPLVMAGVTRKEVRHRVDEMAAQLGLTPLLRRRPHRLSGGQQQRVAMGRALIRRPSLLLMDEPMSNLDAKLRTDLRGAIARLQQRLGITMVYVTHDQVEAMSLGHRIAVMREGTVAQCGTPQELYADPVDLFVATFIGSPPMHLMEATVSTAAGERTLGLGRSVLRLGPEWTARLGDRPTGPVIAGVRPQAFSFADGGEIVADVERISQHGSRLTVDVTVGVPTVAFHHGSVATGPPPSRLALEFDADAIPEAELWRPSSLTVDPVDVHLFDPVTGSSLWRSPTDRTEDVRGRRGTAAMRSANLANTGPTSTVIST